jgi:hypothetical protein
MIEAIKLEDSLLYSSGRTHVTCEKPDNVIIPNKWFCVRNPTGFMVLTMTYLMLSWLYFITVYYGIFNYQFDKKDHSNMNDIDSTAYLVTWTILFTFFFLLMLISHIRAATTQVGFMPKGYDKLNEEDCPQALAILYRERMDEFTEKILKQKIK